MNLIINRNESLSKYKDQIIPTRDALKIMIKALKEGRAKLLIDTNDTLGYHISE